MTHTPHLLQVLLSKVHDLHYSTSTLLTPDYLLSLSLAYLPGATILFTSPGPLSITTSSGTNVLPRLVAVVPTHCLRLDLHDALQQ